MDPLRLRQLHLHMDTAETGVAVAADITGTHTTPAAEQQNIMADLELDQANLG